MIAEKQGSTLVVSLDTGFNRLVRRRLEKRIENESGIDRLRVDMSRSRLIDSEGVIFLYRWQKSGKKLELINPPWIFFEILRILELDTVWDVNG